MAKTRAIVKRRAAVQNIRKITRTMELIATARFKRALDRAGQAARSRARSPRSAADLSASAHRRLRIRCSRIGPSRSRTPLLVLTSNRGLCGGYNAGVLRLVIQKLRKARETEEAIGLEVSGKRGINFLKFQGRPADRTYTQFEDKPTFAQVDELADRFIEGFCSRKFDRLDVAYTKFEIGLAASRRCGATLAHRDIGCPTREADSRDEGQAGRSGRRVRIPSLGRRESAGNRAQAAFKARLFKCFLDAAVSEQIFRRVAMKAATEEVPDDMIGNLSQLYNRARQTQITRN